MNKVYIYVNNLKNFEKKVKLEYKLKICVNKISINHIIYILSNLFAPLKFDFLNPDLLLSQQQLCLMLFFTELCMRGQRNFCATILKTNICTFATLLNKAVLQSLLNRYYSSALSAHPLS